MEDLGNREGCDVHGPARYLCRPLRAAFGSFPSSADRRVRALIALAGLPAWLGSIVDERRPLLLAVHALLFRPASWGVFPWLSFACRVFDDERVLAVEPAAMLLALRNRLSEITDVELDRVRDLGVSATSIFDVLVGAKLGSPDDDSAEPLWMPRIHRVLDTMAYLDPLNVQTITIAFEPDTGRRFTAHLPIPARGAHPADQDERKRIVYVYLAAAIVNHAMILGVAEATVECSVVPSGRAAFGCSSGEVAAELVQLLRRAGYASPVEFVENFRMIAVSPDTVPRGFDDMPFTREDMTYGTMLGIDIGGNDIKMCSFRQGIGSALVRLPTFEEPNKEVDAAAFVDRILNRLDADLRDAALWTDLDAVGIAWPGAVRGGRVAGFSSTLRWLRFPGRSVPFSRSTPAHELQSIDLAGLFVERIHVRRRTAAPVVATIENDGNAEAYGNFCLRELRGQARPGAKIVLKLGTSLAGGHITAEGAVSPHLAEPSKTLLDFRRVASGRTESAAAREFVSSKGMRNLSRTFRFRGRPLFGDLGGINDETTGRERIESVEIGRLLGLWREIDADAIERNRLLDELAEGDDAGAGPRATELERDIAARVRRGPWEPLRAFVAALGRDYRDRPTPDPELAAESDQEIGRRRLGRLLGRSITATGDDVSLDAEGAELLAEKIVGSVALVSRLAVHVAHMIALLYNVYGSDRSEEVILAGGPLSGVSGQVVQRQSERFLLRHYGGIFGPGRSLEPGTVGLVQVVPEAGDPVPDRNGVGPLGAAMIASRLHKALGLAELRKAVDLRLAELRAGQAVSAEEMLAAVYGRLPRVAGVDVARRLAELAADGRLMPHADGMFVKAGP